METAARGSLFPSFVPSHFYFDAAGKSHGVYSLVTLSYILLFLLADSHFK